jgi:hypothetical protein
MACASFLEKKISTIRAFTSSNAFFISRSNYIFNQIIFLRKYFLVFGSYRKWAMAENGRQLPATFGGCPANSDNGLTKFSNLKMKNSNSKDGLRF